MMKMSKIKHYIIAALLAANIFLPLAIVTPVNAQVDPGSKNAACEGLGFGASNCSEPTAANNVDKVVGTVVDIFSWIVGLLAVIMIVLAGFKFVTAGGDSSKIASAKSNIIYALVGVAAVAAAQTLVVFVFGRASGS